MFNINLTQFWLFLAIFIRVITIISVAPIFGSLLIPAQIKIAISLILSVSIFIFMDGKIAPPVLNNMVEILLFTVKQLIIAAFIALFIHIIWAAAQMAGELLGYLMGLSLANVISQNSIQVSLLSELEGIFAILIFLAIDGHYWFIEAIYQSFSVIGWGSINLNQQFLKEFIDLGAQFFIMAAKIGMPGIVSMLLVSVSFAILSRTIPQMNILIVGFPIKIAVGLMVLGVSFSFIGYALSGYYEDFHQNLIPIMRLFGHG